MIEKPAPLKSKSGVLLYDKLKKLERFVENYTDLYSTDSLVSKRSLEQIPQVMPLSDLDAEPNFKDIDNSIACNKAPGQESIPPRLSRAAKRCKNWATSWASAVLL